MLGGASADRPERGKGKNRLGSFSRENERDALPLVKKFLRPPADSLRRGRVFRYVHAHVDVAAPALEKG